MSPDRRYASILSPTTDNGRRAPEHRGESAVDSVFPVTNFEQTVYEAEQERGAAEDAPSQEM